MATITGKLIAIDPDADNSAATIDFVLCGYGAQFPRAIWTGSQVGSFSTVERKGVGITGAGETFSVGLVGNDNITPPGTYYTVTTRNPNGDILQCNAYVFNESGSPYDLDFAIPFDPSQPMAPVPAQVAEQLWPQNGGPTAEFNADDFLSFQMTLNQDAVLQITGGKVGNLYTFIVQQDNVGGHAFDWGTEFYNASVINPDPNGLTIQTFVLTESLQYFPIAAGMWYTPPSGGQS